MSRTPVQIVLDAAPGIEIRNGVELRLEAIGDVVWITTLNRTTGPNGAGMSALGDVMGVADQNGVDLAISAVEGRPKLISLYQQAGFTVVGVSGDDEVQRRWLKDHEYAWEADGKRESVPMRRRSMSHVYEAAHELVQRLRNDEAVERASNAKGRRRLVRSHVDASAAYHGVKADVLSKMVAYMIDGRQVSPGTLAMSWGSDEPAGKDQRAFTLRTAPEGDIRNLTEGFGRIIEEARQAEDDEAGPSPGP